MLEEHAMNGETLYPVAVTVLPFLFDIIRRGSPLGLRIADLIAKSEVALRDQSTARRESSRSDAPSRRA